MSKFEAWVVWGRMEEFHTPENYSFNTDAELAAFWKGVEESQGWDGFMAHDTEDTLRVEYDEEYGDGSYDKLVANG